MLERADRMVKLYIMQMCCVAKPHDKGTANASFTDIFNGSLPYIYFSFTIRRDYNGGVHIPSTCMDWEDITNFQLTVNGNICGPVIKNSKQAYWHLHKMLHLTNEEGFAIIGYEIPPTEDSQLKVLLIETQGELSVDITFDAKAGVNLQTFHIALFQNQLNCGFARVPFLSFFN